VTEVVSLMVHLNRMHIDFQCFAPNENQTQVVNHLTGETSTETRNVLVESARIARGEVKDIAELKGEDYQAVILPGGFGVAKNLSDYAVNGGSFNVHEQVTRVLKVRIISYWRASQKSFIQKFKLTNLFFSLFRSSMNRKNPLVQCASALSCLPRSSRTRNLELLSEELTIKNLQSNTGLTQQLSVLLRLLEHRLCKETLISSRLISKTKLSLPLQ